MLLWRPVVLYLFTDTRWHHKWHGIAPNDEQLKEALSQLEETLGDF